MRLVNRIVLALGLVAATAGSALADLPGGTLVITDHQVSPQSPTFEKDLKKAQKTTLVKEGPTWKLFFVAYLKKPAPTGELNIVFYDVTGGKREQGNAFPVGTKQGAKIMMSEVELSPEQDFKAGHKYQVKITRLVGGKEEVFASANVDLK